MLFPAFSSSKSNYRSGVKATTLNEGGGGGMGSNEIIYEVSVYTARFLKCLQEREQFNLSQQVLSRIESKSRACLLSRARPTRARLLSFACLLSRARRTRALAESLLT